MNEGVFALVVSFITAGGVYYQSFVKSRNDSSDNFREDFTALINELKTRNNEIAEENEQLQKRLKEVIKQNETLITQNRNLHKKLNKAIILLERLDIDVDHLKAEK